MPDVIVIAGPNGAGKSTLAPDLLREHFPNIPFINADSIAEELSPSRRGVEIEAGRIMLRRMRELGDAQASFAFETTLSGRGHYRFLQQLRKRHDYGTDYLSLASGRRAFNRKGG